MSASSHGLFIHYNGVLNCYKYYNAAVKKSTERDKNLLNFFCNSLFDKIKEIKKNSKEAVLLNNGKEFAVIYGHLNEGEELRMFIMGMENVHDYYDPYVKKEDEVSNMTGWYVGTYAGIPAFCIPALLGGG